MTVDETQLLMRAPCPHCGGLEGVIRPQGLQDCVYCVACGRWCYNAPRAETGRAPRRLAGRTSIPVSKQYRIKERASGRCELCGARDELVVDHILSLKDGRDLGLSDFELNHDENLAALCPPCNSGKGAISMSPRVYIALLRSRAS